MGSVAITLFCILSVACATTMGLDRHVTWSVDFSFRVGTILGRQLRADHFAFQLCHYALSCWSLRAKEERHDMGDYFSRKFFPLQASFVLGRSYAAEPTCEPRATSCDPWRELVT